MNDGSALESAIARYFDANGYEVERNRIIEGRSGAPHEIDVLAIRPDPVAQVTVAVECKAWKHPVDKTVLSKLDYVLRDCGLNKGIVVSTGGFRSGAESAANELSIDLWGPAELSHFLGAAEVEAVQTPHPVRQAMGWPFTSTADQAGRAIRGEARGSVLLRRQESVLALSPAWLPVNLAWISIAQERRKWGRTTTVSHRVLNCYDALDGRLLSSPSRQPGPIELGSVPSIGSLKRPAQAQARISKAFKDANKVTTEAAISRHAGNLARLGLPWPCVALTVDHVEAFMWPLWVALLDCRGTQRLIAVDGASGSTDPELSASLTSEITHVRKALG